MNPAPTVMNRRRVCAKCGDPQPMDGSACPKDGSTVFTTESLMMDVPVKADPLLGARLGDYEVQEVIGDGGMGIVYRGLQPVIQKKVAIKVLRPDVANDQTLVRRFLSEAKAVNAISHRNIVDIFTLGTLPDGRPYIVMELLDGVPLDRYLREKAPLSPKEVVELLLEISAPLGAAHAAGVVHRDLKPSNIFMVRQSDGTRYLKLLDFGLAKWSVDQHSAQTSSHMVTGTPDYMSPEQARGLEVTPRGDLYALGVMAFEMLTGNVPFRGATPMDVMMQHVQTPPPALLGVPKDLAALVLALMAKTPELRLAPTERVRRELQQVKLEGTAVSPAAKRPVKSSRGWVAPVLVTVPLLAGVVGVSLAMLRERGPAAMGVAPAPPVRPEPKPEPPAAPAPAPAPEPAPVAVATPAPPPAPEPPHPNRPAVVKAPASTADALLARMSRLEARLRRSVEPGEEPDPSALVLLKKLRLSLATSRTPDEHKQIEKSVDDWEKTFLSGSRP